MGAGSALERAGGDQAPPSNISDKPDKGTTTDANGLATYKFGRRPCYDASRTVFNGATALQWGRICLTYCRDVEWSKYGWRFVFLCMTSLCMSIIALVEMPFCWLALRRQKINERPVFILGHPRSGTTLLHNMMALDSDRFMYCTTMHCLFPSVFLILSKIRCIFEAALPPTRPMDNVPLGFDLPQEDEVANMILTGGLSPFLLFFYQKKPHVKRLLDCLDFYRGADGQRPQSVSMTLPPAARAVQAAVVAEQAFSGAAPANANIAGASSASAASGASAGEAKEDADAMEAGAVRTAAKPAGAAAVGDVEEGEAVSMALASAPVTALLAATVGGGGAARAGASSSPAAATAAAAEEDAPTNKYYRRWEKCWLHFLRKVSFAGGADEKRLLLKSPAHTARVRVLLKLFPNAQFIYVHRNPYEVFQSMAKMVGSIADLSNLYDASDAECTDFILEQYKVMFEAYVADRSLIPAGNLVELSYMELEDDLVGSLSGAYRALGWEAAPTEQWRAYAEKHHGANYKKNSHSRLTAEMRRRIAGEWADTFRTFGYDF